jgi:hypothetical protein
MVTRNGYTSKSAEKNSIFNKAHGSPVLSHIPKNLISKTVSKLMHMQIDDMLQYSWYLDSEWD